ncbi:MAG TPA: hypothetical protein VKV04_11705 [Verrucomicrobiae bacterium]|nr:hypothetical protein [Verrucomicrobiae bacterium]
MISLRAGRFLIVALSSLLAIGGIWLSMVLFTNPSSPSFYGSFCYIFLAIAAWPFELCVLIRPAAPPAVVTFLLFVISGLFWAAVVDVSYELKKKYNA